MGLETQPLPEGSAPTDASEAAPLDDWPTPAAPASELPPIAAKADDLEAIKKAVEDAAAVSGALWFSYLFVLFYFAIATGAVTHEDLFFERSVKLPFLGIDLPLLAFFFLAPILFVIVHAYTLVHLVMLTDKAKRFDQALHHQIGQRSDLPKYVSDRRAVIRGLLQRQLPSNIFVQFLAGHADIREGLFGWLLQAIAWSTLVVAPVLLLLLMQIQFLPFHSTFITWTHRVALLADLALIWWLWRRIQSGREVERLDPIAAVNWIEIAALASVAAILFSWTVGTFPGELQEDFLAKWDEPKWTVTPHNWLFSGPIDETTRHRTSLFPARSSCPVLISMRASASTIPTRQSGASLFFVRAAATCRAQFWISRTCRKSTSLTLTCRARRSRRHNFKKPGSRALCFRERLSMAASFKVQLSLLRTLRAHLSLARSSKARCYVRLT